ncbi:MAG TPA: sigma-70 family RNA polymerase sigma factor [Candidatus Binataceae bacterium]|nr:sigma-70 family RNA polymerase sigma factor [Candidatus Binataceae bacterium]
MKTLSSAARPAGEALLAHLDAAYNLARWLVRNDQDAEDIVQEAFIRASRTSESTPVRDMRAWMMAIVRNTAYTWIKRNRPAWETEISTDPASVRDPSTDENLEADAIRRADRRAVIEAMEELALEFREVIVLREFEDFSYREIAEAIGAPIGTVMSRLARARANLRRILAARMRKEV